jgi:diaminopimelate decarboxylase
MNKPNALPVHAPMNPVPDTERRTRRRRPAAFATRRARVGQTPFYAYDRICSRGGSPNCGPRCRDPETALRDEGQPDAGAGLPHGQPGRRHRRGIGRRTEGRPRRRRKSARNQLCRPWKTDARVAQAVAAGILINIESFREVTELARSVTRQVARRACRRARKPGFRAEEFRNENGRRPQAVWRGRRAGTRTAGRNRPSSGLAFEGFHLFAGSQNLKPEAIVEAQCKSYGLALRLARSAPSPVRFLNLGGGFGIPYFPANNRSIWRRSAPTWRSSSSAPRASYRKPNW